MIPPFYSPNEYHTISNFQKIKFYDKFSYETAIMLGTVSFILTVLSKQLNITLSHPLLVLGSKSYVRLKNG
jgi:hypothetical protein